MTAVKTTAAFAPVAAADWKEQEQKLTAARNLAKKQSDLKSLTDSAESYRTQEESYRTVAQHVRGLLKLLHEAGIGPSFTAHLNEALEYTVSSGNSSKRYALDYDTRAKRLQAEIDGNVPADDDRAI